MRAISQTLVARQPRAADALALVDGFVRRRAHDLLARIDRGEITLVDGDERTTFGRAGSLKATVTVRSPAAYRAVFLGGSVGGAEAYMSGHWTCDDLASLARILARNLHALDAMEGGAARISRFVSQLAATARRNTRAGSRRNIAHHYDLSNDFFRLFLDESMMYSSAVFASSASTLEEAQTTKLEHVCQKLALGPGDHLLEIGTGWGALAIHAAQRYGCRVTTTTVSAEQHRLATERVRAAGLEEKVDVVLHDYRDLRGRYDKLVSIEMIEAVGHEYLDDYFRACSERLTPDGVMLIQAITIADQQHAQHRTSVDFIKEYIFPGSCIPSVTTMVDAATRATDLRLFQLEDLTPHYARTLRIWRERFLANADAVRRLGFDETFLRMWEYYLAYCEGGFEERYLGSVQMVFTKPDARHTPSAPRATPTTVR
jgi:cyclopropane-fatty-acyl-phospholipid synthase